MSATRLVAALRRATAADGSRPLEHMSVDHCVREAWTSLTFTGERTRLAVTVNAAGILAPIEEAVADFARVPLCGTIVAEARITALVATPRATRLRIDILTVAD